MAVRLKDVFINSGILHGQRLPQRHGNNIVPTRARSRGCSPLAPVTTSSTTPVRCSSRESGRRHERRLINSGTIQDGLFASLAITGGSGTDRLVNKMPSMATSILDGDDKFINRGSVSGAVTLGGGYDELENTGEIFGNVSLGSCGGVFINAGVVRGQRDARRSFDTGFLDSSQGAIYGSIVGGGVWQHHQDLRRGQQRSAGAGFDNVRGGAGDDTISTFDGGDLLMGGGGDDKLNGGRVPTSWGWCWRR